MRIAILSVISLVFLMTGCVKQPNYVNSDSKRAIYESVKDTIRDAKIEGDYLYKNGYFLESANAYKSVNFYENRNVVSSNTLKKIKSRADANGKHYYKSALKNMKNKKVALKQLNRLYRNVKSYKNSDELFEVLKEDPKIVLFLESLETPLKKALEKKKSLKNINNALLKLSLYDDSNSVVIEAKNYIRNECRILLHDAVDLYNKQQYSESIRKFQTVQTIYKDSKEIKNYLRKMQSKKSTKRMKKTKNLTKEDKKQKEIILDLIVKGKNHYNKQDFVNAKKAFSKVLNYELDNNTSKTYLEKITRQLETIEQLK